MFLINKLYTGGFVPAAMYVDSTASETYSVGEALTLSSGAATICPATTVPTYICGEAYVAPASGQRKILVYPVLKGIEYETIAYAALTSVNYGDKVTLHTDGLQITATTTSGVAELTYKASNDAGAVARIRF